MSTPVPTPPRPSAAERRSEASAGTVLRVSVALILAFLAVTLLLPEQTERALTWLERNVIGSFGWFYTLLVVALVVFCLILAFGPSGRIRLGRDDEPPEFSLGAWFSMVFACGMGIGLVFWGPAEPLSHFVHPRPGTTGTGPELAQAAMVQTFLHWGPQAWAIYAAVGLAIAYTLHRRRRPLSFRWALEPVLGSRVKGGLGDAIDIVTVLGTVFGVATTLGFGALQITAGLDHTGLAPATPIVQVVVVVAVTILATISVVSGVDRGIRILSNLNMVLAGVLLLVVVALGPTLFLLRETIESIGAFLQGYVGLSFDLLAYDGDAGAEWKQSWTVFYWGWWISWAPFVGLFIARISRGRTIRQFVLGTMLAPTLVTFVWFGVFGGAAIHRQLFGPGDLTDANGDVPVDFVMFDLLDGLGAGRIGIAAMLLLIAVFFVTSADSGALVVGMLSSGRTEPSIPMRILWTAALGAVGIVLLLRGGLDTMRTATILIALPFSVVLIGMMVALAKSLSRENARLQVRDRLADRDEVAAHVVEAVANDPELRDSLVLAITEPAPPITPWRRPPARDLGRRVIRALEMPILRPPRGSDDGEPRPGTAADPGTSTAGVGTDAAGRGTDAAGRDADAGTDGRAP
ncbi:choline/glycine/proline betaine transport protein [Salana multivorans]|uniref:Choline/glycine/proline betaine transport protein n=1 Tax=Salana multivorans TaxID=120377 RepID=A0A3N2D889_9MICO|nr:BCCT family transporter [Salana multivorans]ROR96006.1 choline/glycine/proline betaine transport protein [Salana multivorans]